MIPEDPTSGTRSRQSSGSWTPPSVNEMQQLLPQYDILELLGRGGMGAVYKARQKSLNRIVAIKILPLEFADDALNFAARFKLEAQTIAQLNHPGIVSVHDFGETMEGQLWFAMEFVDGTDVAKMIEEVGRLPIDTALNIARGVCEALGYAHRHGVIHRDIKPANILVDKEGHVKVADFGLAKTGDHSRHSGLTRTNVAMGTQEFAAPELTTPGATVDHRADIYSLGVMLYQMVTGTIPRVMFKLPSLWRPELGARFDTLICRALETDPADRYQSVQDFQRDLEAAAAAVAQAPSQSWRKNPLLVIAAALVVALVMAAAYLWKGGLLPGAQVVKREGGAPVRNVTGASQLSFQGHRYQFVPGVGSWTEAAARAKGMGGHLARIDSLEKLNWVAAQFARNVLLAQNTDFWVDGTRASANSMWQWHDGSSAEVITRLPDTFLDVGHDLKRGEFPAYLSMVHFHEKYHLDDKSDAAIPAIHWKKENVGFLVEWDQAEPSGKVVDLLPLVDVNRDAINSTWTKTPQGELRSLREHKAARLEFPYAPPAEYDFEIDFTVEAGDSGYVLQVLAVPGHWLDWRLLPPPAFGPALDGVEPGNGPRTEGIGQLFRLKPGDRHQSVVEVRKNFLRAFVDGIEIAHFAGDLKRLSDPFGYFKLRDTSHLGVAVLDTGLLIHKATVREVGGSGLPNKIAATPSASPKTTTTTPGWTDWTAVDIRGRGWIADGDGVTTEKPIQGFNILPFGTGDAAMRVTYTVHGSGRESAGVGITARAAEHGLPTRYYADDGGDTFSIMYAALEDSAVKIRDRMLQRKSLAGSLSREGEHTLEFRIVGDALTATLDETTTLSAKDDSLKQGGWALVIRKGVRVTKLEMQTPRAK